MSRTPTSTLRRRLRPWQPIISMLALSFLLTAASVDGFAPLALGLAMAAQSQLTGLAAILGATAGALAFLDFQPGLRHLASVILLYTARLSLGDTKLWQKEKLRLAVGLATTAMVQSIYLLQRPLPHTLAFLLSLLWQALAAWSFQKKDPILLAQALPLLLSRLTLPSGFSLGRAVLPAVLLSTLRRLPTDQALALGMLTIVTTSLDGKDPVYPLTCACALTLAALHPDRRLWPVAAFLGSAVLLPTLYGQEEPGLLLAEMLTGLLLAQIPKRKKAPAKPEQNIHKTVEKGWQKGAAAFRELYDSFFRGTHPQPMENPSIIFDRAAEQVCRGCVLRENCWQQNYTTTYSAFNHACAAILNRGSAEAGDFPLYFTAKCVHIREFLAAVTTETKTFLLRRQYHRRLEEARQQAREQYAQLGELLSTVPEAVEAAAPLHPLGYRVGSALRPKRGEALCGDQLAVFESGDTLYLLLSDGMGSGESAHREAAMTVRLLKQFLTAGIEPVPALKTLNAALALRGEEGGGFTTIDLLAISRTGGGATLYKYGAAPSYCKRTGAVTRYTASSLPAGLQASDSPPATRLHLTGGSYFVMVSDGIADETDDEWLQNLLAGWSGGDAASLTSLIMAESRSRKGLEDDCAVLVLELPGRSV